MVVVAKKNTTRLVADSEQVDRQIAFLQEAWDELPDYAQQPSGMSLAEQLSYVEEWPANLQIMARLERLDAGGQLSDVQHIAFARVRRTATQLRTILDNLLRT